MLVNFADFLSEIRCFFLWIQTNIKSKNLFFEINHICPLSFQLWLFFIIKIIHFLLIIFKISYSLYCGEEIDILISFWDN